MGLFDQMVGGVLGKVGGTGALGGLLNSALGGSLGDALPGMVNSALAKTEFGSLAGLVTYLQENGLADQVASWLSSGENLQVTAQQLISVIGQEHLAHVATAVGLPPETVGDLLSQHLPGLIDKLSPNGQIELPTA
ncbi:YidB family protein [Xanthobacter sp. TB0136]|uniref:YidB family protein n=1 Tax=Xanthobacter sp. TB0136 TaxID=3459177 RepID=UPI004039E2C0